MFTIMIIIGTITQTNIYRLVSYIDINNIKIINIMKICFHTYLICTKYVYFNASLMQATCNLHIFLIIQYGLEFFYFFVSSIDFDNIIYKIE